MAKYIVYGPCYINGVHLADGATVGKPSVIELPDNVEPSVKWDPLDKAALDNLDLAVESLADRLAFGITDKARIDQIKETTRKKHKKVLTEAPPEPVKPREISTNVEAQEARSKVVGRTGRASDRSPV